jgi:transcriptional regulator with XRE-family HTH domain
MTHPATPEQPSPQMSTPAAPHAHTLASWLREQRLARKWTAFEMARQLHQAAKNTGDSTVSSLAILTGYIYRWEGDRMGVSERYRLHYCTALDIPFHQFGPEHLWPQEETPSPPPKPTSTPPAHTSTPGNCIHVITLIIPHGRHQITIDLPTPAPPSPPDPQPRPA